MVVRGGGSRAPELPCAHAAVKDHDRFAARQEHASLTAAPLRAVGNYEKHVLFMFSREPASDHGGPQAAHAKPTSQRLRARHHP
jgi:hypothetical protein